MQTQKKPLGMYHLDGKDYPIVEYITHNQKGELLKKPVPVVDLPQMSDYHWQQMSLESRMQHPENYPGEDLSVTIPALQRWLAEHREAVIA